MKELRSDDADSNYLTDFEETLIDFDDFWKYSVGVDGVHGKLRIRQNLRENLHILERESGKTGKRSTENYDDYPDRKELTTNI